MDVPPPALSPGFSGGGGGIDIFLGDMPVAAKSPLAPLDLDLEFAVPASPIPLPDGLPLSLDLDGLPDLGPPLASAAPPTKSPPQITPQALDLSLDPALEGLMGDAVSPPAGPPPGSPRPPPAAPPPGLDLSGLGDMDLPPIGSLSVAAPAKSDLGFSLEMEGAAPAGVSRPGARAHPMAMPNTTAGDLPGNVARMAPPKKRQGARLEPVSTGPQSRLKLFSLIGAIIVLLGIGATFALPLLTRGPSIASALLPYESDLGRDQFSAYGAASDALVQTAATAPQSAPALKAQAAELLLLSVLGRGADRGRIAKAEGLIADLKPDDPIVAEVARARALVAVARGRGTEVDGLLGTHATSPEGQLILGLRRVFDGKLDLALAPLKLAAAGGPRQVLARFVLGVAQRDSNKIAEASATFAQVLVANPGHSGAMVGRLKMQSGAPPEQRLKEAEALVSKIGSGSSPADQSDLYLAMGEALLAVGRVEEGGAALQKAVGLNTQNAAAIIALGHAYLFDGKVTEALGRFRGGGAAVVRIPVGKLGLGGALIANGQVAEGESMVRDASAVLPQDPRSPYFLALAAEKRRIPNLDAAAEGYRKALSLDAKFIPAALRLAALLQARGKPTEAVEVLQKIQKAGAPGATLELAWGQALVNAGDTTQAVDVFRKALLRDLKSGPARLGLASALEAAGKLNEAAAELEKTVKELPETPEVRRRLAAVLVKRGMKVEALALLEEDFATGKASLPTQVDLGRLALDLGQVERAAQAIQKVVAQTASTPGALFTLGRIREAQGEPSRAAQEYKRAAMFESGPDLRLANGRVLLKIGRDQDGIRELEAAGELPGAHLDLGRYRLRKGEIEDARKDLEAEIKLSPKSAEAFVLLGEALDKMGKADAAAEKWRMALQVGAENREARYRLGRYEFDRGKIAAALPHFRAAADKLPSDLPWAADLYFQMGLAEVGGGSRGAAAPAFRKFLELAPSDSPSRPEAEKQLRSLSGK